MNEKTKKEGYTDQLNQELLGTLGEKASSEQISAAYEKREVHRDTTYHKTNTKHASPWKDTAPAENTLKTRKKKQQGGFARARVTQQKNKLAVIHMEVDILQGRLCVVLVLL